MSTDNERRDDQNEMTDLRELLEDNDDVSTTRRKRRELTELRSLIDKEDLNTKDPAPPENMEHQSSTSDEEGFMEKINQVRQHELTTATSILGYILLFSAFLQMFVVPKNITGFVMICLTAIAGFASLGLPFLFYKQSNSS